MATIGSFNSLAFSNLQSQALPPLFPSNADAATGSVNSTTATPTDDVTLSSPGERLAQSALDAAAGNTDLKKKRCFKFVKQGLAAEGVELSGKSAYMAAGQLARNPQFQERKGVKPSELSELPAGAVVVWNKNSKHPHGHISVALGDGREVSDRIRQQIEGYGTSVRVFLPAGGPTTMNASNNAAPPGSPPS